MSYIVKKNEEAKLSKIKVNDFIEEMKKIIFPGYFESINDDYEKYLNILTKKMHQRIRDICSIYLKENNNEILDKLIVDFDNKFKVVVSTIKTDLEVFMESDPAATSKDEIITCYPGFFAIWVYRIAHIFEELKIPLFPRVMSEYAHSKTGIDIHPKTVIGEAFFIDHGTGIVIGETTIIGSNVKIYQGVTLGASSLSSGKNLKGIKRHPTIGNNVTIYANATILGGDVVIGDRCIIGSNVTITTSIEKNSVVKNIDSGLEIKKR